MKGNNLAIVGYTPVHTYSWTSSLEKMILKARTEEVADKICVCNGKLIDIPLAGCKDTSGGNRFCIRLARQDKISQAPMDWYAYSWKCHGRPDPSSHCLLRGVLEPPDDNGAAAVSHLFQTINDHNSALWAGLIPRGRLLECWSMKKSRVGYDFLFLFSSAETAQKVASGTCAMGTLSLIHI